MAELDTERDGGTHKAKRPTVPPEARRRCLRIVAVAAVLAYAIDLATKIWAVEELSDREPIKVVGTLFQLELIRNPGAAFGLGVGITVVFTVVSLGVVAALLYYARRLGSTGWALVFGLVLGGALGNLTDRILRDPGIGRGHVVDMFHLKNWPVFNVADSAFCIAGGIVVLLAMRNIPLEGRRTEEDDDAAPAEDDDVDMWAKRRPSVEEA
ncbi:MAG: signal peptidase II [Sporichthyaceae bacterium]